MISFLGARSIANTIAGVAEPTRLRIVETLMHKPLAVGEIATALKIPMGNASHHLKVMRHAGILDHRKSGRSVIYSLSKDFVSDEARATLKMREWSLFFTQPSRVTES